jgi:hypothetical protein
VFLGVGSGKGAEEDQDHKLLVPKSSELDLPAVKIVEGKIRGCLSGFHVFGRLCCLLGLLRPKAADGQENQDRDSQENQDDFAHGFSSFPFEIKLANNRLFRNNYFQPFSQH